MDNVPAIQAALRKATRLSSMEVKQRGGRSIVEHKSLKRGRVKRKQKDACRCQVVEIPDVSDQSFSRIPKASHAGLMAKKILIINDWKKRGGKEKKNQFIT